MGAPLMRTAGASCLWGAGVRWCGVAEGSLLSVLLASLTTESHPEVPHHLERDSILTHFTPYSSTGGTLLQGNLPHV